MILFFLTGENSLLLRFRNKFFVLPGAALSFASVTGIMGLVLMGSLSLLILGRGKFLKWFFFNADGSRAETCLNGLRCVAEHLFSSGVDSDHVHIHVGDRLCRMGSEIATTVGASLIHGQKSLTVTRKNLNGYVVTVGNPHFVIFEETTRDWLVSNGKKIESHKSFPNRTNVEFVWKSQENTYEFLVYERGCGCTLACSSGAAAVTGLLGELGAISPMQKITIKMPGGSLVSWIDVDRNITLQAQACRIFTGQHLLPLRA